MSYERQCRELWECWMSCMPPYERPCRQNLLQKINLSFNLSRKALRWFKVSCHETSFPTKPLMQTESQTVQDGRLRPQITSSMPTISICKFPKHPSGSGRAIRLVALSSPRLKVCQTSSPKAATHTSGGGAIPLTGAKHRPQRLKRTDARPGKSCPRGVRTSRMPFTRVSKSFTQIPRITSMRSWQTWWRLVPR